MSEKELIQKLNTGCQTAFENLYHKYSEKVFFISFQFGLSKEDCAEIVQDVFLKVWERRRDLRCDLSFNAYLLTITKNLIIKKSRKNFTRIAFQHYYIQTTDKSHNQTEDLIVFADMLKVTQNFINTLPNQQREVFKMSKIEQLSHKEISDKLNLSIRTIENHVFRATQKLKERLSELGITLILYIILCF